MTSQYKLTKNKREVIIKLSPSHIPCVPTEQKNNRMQFPMAIIILLLETAVGFDPSCVIEIQSSRH